MVAHGSRVAATRRLWTEKTVSRMAMLITAACSLLSLPLPTMLPFEATTGDYRGTGFLRFRVGTCHGLWRSTDTSYEILAVKNREKGNGHFKEALRWFQKSCVRDGKTLRIRECWNPWVAYQCLKHGYTWRWMMDFEKAFSPS